MGGVTLQWLGYDFFALQHLLPPGLFGSLFNRQIALISGHAGNDSGAICTDATGAPTVTEAAIAATVAERVASKLRWSGAQVTILNEFDKRLANLQADLLISLHADSCIDASGYKFAVSSRFSGAATVNQRLAACFEHAYAASTQLAPHPNTITHNMTDYHAFRQIDSQTPALILEMGFIGGDQALLTQQPNTVASGITASIRCFFKMSP
ncbi:MAG: N-acetylmuramoyl-L-alanine amidase [Caldilineaceae bacterium]